MVVKVFLLKECKDFSFNYLDVSQVTIYEQHRVNLNSQKKENAIKEAEKLKMTHEYKARNKQS